MKHLLLLTLLGCLTLNSVAKKPASVSVEPSTDSIIRDVSGYAAIPIVNITPELARQKAMADAKAAALTQAVGEMVAVNTTILQTENKNTFSQISSIESRGGIIAYQIITDAPKSIDNSLHYVVELRCDVKIYPQNQATPAIELDVNGVKPAYKPLERLTFTVQSSDSCYLYIFLLDQQDIPQQVIPANDKQYLHPANKRIKFPIDRAIQYTLYLENPLATQEENNLLIVAFQKPQQITPQNLQSFDNLACWIYSLAPCYRSTPVVLPIRIFSK